MVGVQHSTFDVQRSTTMTDIEHHQLPSLILTEALGFSPQLLVDDIIAAANDIQGKTFDAVEQFMIRWADRRESDSEVLEDVESGIVSFQTLIEYHTDVAFDYLEIWCLRNIFVITPDLPIIMPHHKGLDLNVDPRREMELMAEFDELRRKIQEQRKLKRLYTRALSKARIQRRRAEARRDQVAFITKDALATLASLPTALSALSDAHAALPEEDPGVDATMIESQLPDPAKRPWESSMTGYVHWAKGELSGGPAELARMRVDFADATTKATGDSRVARRIQEAAEKIQDAMDEN